MLIIIYVLICFFSSSQSNVTDSYDFQKLKVVVAMDFGSKSHIKHLLEVTNVLSQRGHEVIYVASRESIRFGKAYTNITKIDLGGSSTPKSELKKMVLKMNLDNKDFSSTALNLGKMIGNTYTERYKQMIDVYNEHKPNVVICDFFFIPCVDAAKKKNIPVISGQCSIDGPILSPSSFMTTAFGFGATTTKNMNIIEKFDQLIVKPLRSNYYDRKSVKLINELRKKVNVNPTTKLFYSKNILVLANSFIGFDVPRAIDPTTVLIGPIADTKIEGLTNDLRAFFASHAKVIYVAFGSVNILPEKHLNNLLYGLFRAYKHKLFDGLVWGLGNMDRSDFPEQIDVDGESINIGSVFGNEHNDIKFYSWAPQVSILAQPNTVLFVSHVGIESIFEALLNEVPILAMPYFGDQPKNAYKLKEHGNGDYLNPKTATREQVYTKLKLMLEDNAEEIKLNAQKMKIVATYSSKRKEFAADVIEQYAKYAVVCRKLDKRTDIPCELRDMLPLNYQMSFFRAYNIDLYSAIMSIIVGVSYVIYSTINTLARRKAQKVKNS